MEWDALEIKWLWGGFGRADGEGQGSAAVAMAVGGWKSAIGNLAGDAGKALDAMEIFADGRADGNANEPLFEFEAKFREQFSFECRSKGAELDFAMLAGSGRMFAELLNDEIAEADPRT